MRTMRIWIYLAVAVLIPSFAAAQEVAAPKLVVPIPDAERGRFLFASKGCVVCHAINGVGGSAGPALDAAADSSTVDPVDFAARMWRGAAAMAFLQSMEFGYQIALTGNEISDLAAFIASPERQSTFTESDIPEVMRGWTIDEPFSALEEEWDPWGIDSALSDLDVGRIGNMTRGYMLAERWCTTCHVVDAEGEGGDVGPAFASVAAREGSSEEAIRDWLSVPHPNMPEFLNLNDNDFSDLAAYIMSLKR